MIQLQLKMRMTKAQEKECERYLFHLQSVYNWAVRKIELNAKDNIYFPRLIFKSLLDGHSAKLDIYSHVIRGTLDTAYDAWRRCFKKLNKRPRLKGARNPLRTIVFPDRLTIRGNRVRLGGIGEVRFHRQVIPEGTVKLDYKEPPTHWMPLPEPPVIGGAP